MLLLGAATIVALALAMSAAALAANRLPWSDPPGILPRLVVYLTRNVAQTQVRADFPELAPFVLTGEPRTALQQIADACRALGWQEVVLDPAAQRVTAVVRSRVFGFRDDVEASVRSSSPQGVTIELRSASRTGRGDLGANTRHVMDLREQLAAAGTRAAAQHR